MHGLCQPVYIEPDQTLVCTGGRQVVNTYIFKLRQFVLTIIREIVQALHILHVKLAS